ncbi:MAG: Asp-tRNA(Asn)/Glu-tRNA(Gln) amidotransferase subunit GatB, partial [Verrucomicrobiota bacterium]
RCRLGMVGALGQSTTIDFNRAGTPLMEIVSEPEIETAEEAFAYLTSLRQILTYGKVSDADMEKGQMRCDVNISLRKKASDPLGAKIELKNLNSVSGVRRGIAYEIIRQAEALDTGETLVQSTRRWDDDQGETQLMRTKEDAHDYRYFPDPDLLPIETGAIIERVRSRVPELPHQKCARFEKDFGISAYDASVLSSDPLLADFFEKTAAGVSKPKLAANWIINDLLSALNEKETNIEHCSLEAEKLGRLIKLVEDGKISNNQAKEVFADLFETGRDPDAIVKEKGMEQVSDTGALDAFISQVIEENPKAVEDIKGGNPKPINFLKGQVMKLSKGKANPKVVGEMLESKLLG